jgi:hypothetical protein
MRAKAVDWFGDESTFSRQATAGGVPVLGI